MPAISIETLNIHIAKDPITPNETIRETFNRYQEYIKQLDSELRENFDESKYNQFIAYKQYVGTLKDQIKRNM